MIFRNTGILVRNGVPISYTPSAPSFNPLDYSPIAWYDSSDVASITKDGGNLVSQWDDKSGNLYHLTQGNATYQPTYSATDGIVFDGSNDWLKIEFGTVFAQPNTIFIVAKSDVTAAQRFIIDNYTTFGVNRVTAFYYNSNAINFQAGSGISVLTNQTNLHLFTSLNKGASSFVQIDGGTPTTGNVGTDGIDSFTVGGIYQGLVPELMLDGYIKEIIVYNSELTTEQINIVNDYLNAKYTIY